jgi:hypothetical protein
MLILQDPYSYSTKPVHEQLVAEVRRFAIPLLTAASARGSVSTWDAGGTPAQGYALGGADFPARSEVVGALADGRTAWLHGGSRMS